MPTLGNLGRAEAGLNQNIAALGTESSGNGLGEGVDTSQESGTALNTELDLLLFRVSVTNRILLAVFRAPPTL